MLFSLKKTKIKILSAIVKGFIESHPIFKVSPDHSLSPH